MKAFKSKYRKYSQKALNAEFQKLQAKSSWQGFNYETVQQKYALVDEFLKRKLPFPQYPQRMKRGLFIPEELCPYCLLFEQDKKLCLITQKKPEFEEYCLYFQLNKTKLLAKEQKKEEKYKKLDTFRHIIRFIRLILSFLR